jgi:hypothetical protein
MKAVLVVAALLAVTACGSGGKQSSPTTTTGPTSPPPTSTTPLVTAPPASGATTQPEPAPAGSGSIALTVRSPLQFSGAVATSVVCATERGHYAAEASGFPVQQDTVSMSVNISGYGNPSTYSSPVTVEFLAADGTSDKVTQTIAVKIVDPQHGQFTITGTDDLGKKIDADFNWTCS